MSAKFFNPLARFDQIEQLSGMDASFVYTETSKTPMHIGSICIYDPSTAPDGKVRYKDILNYVGSRLHLTKSFRQMLKRVPLNIDHPYWVNDPDFDIEFHIRHIALPQPGDWRQLCIQAARIHSRPIDMSKPLWEFWVIEGLDNIPDIPKGSYAIISKIHHSAIDGVSGVEIVKAVHTLSPEIVEINAPEEDRKVHRPSNFELLARAQVNALTKPFHRLDVARRMAPGALKYLAGVRRGEFELFGNSVPRTRFNGVASGHRVVEGRMFELEKIKDIRKKVPGATVNDVMLTLVGGALRKYLDGKNELPTDSLIAMAPVSVRSESEKGAMGNEVSALSIALGTHIRDPLSRLHYVFDTTKTSKATSNAIGARQLSDASKLAPSMVSGVAARLYTRLGLANRIKPIFNTVVSNVPGPPVPLYMNGARMVASYGLGPVLDGVGLFHAVTSYCGQIAVFFSSCRKMLPDPEFYAQCLQESYDELYDVTVAKTGKKKRKRTAVGKSTNISDKTKDKAAIVDDLTMINGIGKTISGKLHAYGVTSFSQIAKLTASDIKKIEKTLNFKGRISRDDWVQQAKALAKIARGNRAGAEQPTVH